MTIYNIQRISNFIKFESEIVLENFIWDNLNSLLRLTPLKRQYWMPGQYHDILGLSEDQLSIIELKNQQDRYVTHQITRYFHSIKESQPFSEKVNYSKPIRLIVIAPSFHEDNFVQRKYTSLNIDFFQFNIIEENGENYFELLDGDKNTISRVVIPVAAEKLSEEIVVQEPIKKLSLILSKLEEREKREFTKVREYILKANQDMNELTDSSSVFYGKTKNKRCLEVMFDNSREQLALFLWLPFKNRHYAWNERQFIGRLRIWTDWQDVLFLGHVPKGLGRKVTFEEFKKARVKPLRKLLGKYGFERYNTDESWRSQLSDQAFNQYNENPLGHYTSGFVITPLQYIKILNTESNNFSFSAFLDLSLEIWKGR
jgi:hypothetical protein